jgi:hypothetical protein
MALLYLSAAAKALSGRRRDKKAVDQERKFTGAARLYRAPSVRTAGLGFDINVRCPMPKTHSESLLYQPLAQCLKSMNGVADTWRGS